MAIPVESINPVPADMIKLAYKYIKGHIQPPSGTAVKEEQLGSKSSHMPPQFQAECELRLRDPRRKCRQWIFFSHDVAVMHTHPYVCI